jgi:hypothetical protein
MPRAPPVIAPPLILRQDWETLTRLASMWSKPLDFWRNWQIEVRLVLMPKPRNCRCDFEAQITKLYHHRFWGQTRRNRPNGFVVKLVKNHPSGFEVKPLTNCRPWFWGSTKKHMLLISSYMVQTAHSVTRPPDRPATEYPTCAIIPDPQHQVSYSCHDPHRCPPCCTCHLHTTRQANMILHIIQRIKVKQLKCLGFEFKPRQVNDSSQSNQETDHFVSHLVKTNREGCMTWSTFETSDRTASHAGVVRPCAAWQKST